MPPDPCLPRTDPTERHPAAHQSPTGPTPADTEHDQPGPHRTSEHLRPRPCPDPAPAAPHLPGLWRHRTDSRRARGGTANGRRAGGRHRPGTRIPGLPPGWNLPGAGCHRTSAAGRGSAAIRRHRAPECRRGRTTPRRDQRLCAGPTARRARERHPAGTCLVRGLPRTNRCRAPECRRARISPRPAPRCPPLPGARVPPYRGPSADAMPPRPRTARRRDTTRPRPPRRGDTTRPRQRVGRYRRPSAACGV